MFFIRHILLQFCNLTYNWTKFVSMSASSARKNSGHVDTGLNVDVLVSIGIIESIYFFLEAYRYKMEIDSNQSRFCTNNFF